MCWYLLAYMLSNKVDESSNPQYPGSARKGGDAAPPFGPGGLLKTYGYGWESIWTRERKA